ncbi:VirB4 family type IV secretion system protein [Candidatus Palauibacter sp.]|uniref:VirB4 family type IV secretion system protein n=1 Tax=Candidatus Palauibacter sp. TaxID=3101350 RepID=UPI003B52067A
MRVGDERRAYEAAGSLAEELPYWGWLDDGQSCLTRAGELVAAGRIRPAVTDGRTPEQIDRVLGLWQRLLSGLGAGTRLQFHLLRRPSRTGSPQDSGSDIASLSGRKRRTFLAGRVQRLDSYAVWTHNPGLRQVGGRSGSGSLSRLKRLRKRGGKTGATYLASEIESAADRFRAMIAAGRSLVAEHTPVEMLGAHEASGILSDLTNKPGTFWDGATGSGMNWRLALSELEAERSHLRLDGEPVILYSLLSPPGQAHANLLQDLYCLDAVTTVSLEWRPWTVEAARRRIRSAQRHYFARRYSMMAHAQDAQGTAAAMVDSAAAAESDRLGSALVELEADGVAYGEASLTVALHGELEEIERLDGDVRRLFAAHDAKVIREGYGQLPTWFARLPAQPRKRQVRRVFVSAGVAACLAPVFGPPKGNRTSRHLDREPLAVFETPWRTAYRYDLFAGDVGHTLILGATGSGKSFALNFLLVESLKYDPRILILDLGGSYRWLTRFLGGRYLELAPGETEPTLRLQPFALPPTTRTFQFLTGWVLRLLKLGGYEADGSDTSEIRARIEDLYALGAERRTLSVLFGSLPVAMWPALSRWTEGGAWGAFFDNAPSDAADIEFRDWQVIDLAGAAEHADLCEAALSYLLERMRLEIEDPAETARLKLMVVDEAWRYMQDPAVLNYLAEAAKTWRKKNAALVLATQSAVDVTGTPGASALLESIPTKLFLANPELPNEAGALFRLNESEIAQVRELTPKRELYLRRPDEAAVLRLEVDPESYWLYTSSPLDAEKRAEAVAKHGLVRGLEVLARPNPSHTTPKHAKDVTP